jgi:hypothetical protein
MIKVALNWKFGTSTNEHFMFSSACKVNAKLSLCLTKHHAMKTHGGVEVQFHAFLTLELDGGE